MTYCVGVLLKEGIVFGSDSRTHAGVDDFASFCKMTVFERPGDRVLVLLSSGSLAGTQAVISVLTQKAEVDDGSPNLWNAETMKPIKEFDVGFWVIQVRFSADGSRFFTASAVDYGGDLDQGGVEMIQMCLCGLMTELGVPGAGGGGSCR